MKIQLLPAMCKDCGCDIPRRRGTERCGPCGQAHRLAQRSERNRANYQARKLKVIRRLLGGGGAA